MRGDQPLQVVAHNHTSITFRVPPGESARNNLTVTVFGQVSDVVNFTYNPPVITELQDASGAPLVFGGCCRFVPLGLAICGVWRMMHDAWCALSTRCIV